MDDANERKLCLGVYEKSLSKNRHQSDACPTCKKIRELEQRLPSNTDPKSIIFIVLYHSLPPELADLIRDIFLESSLNDLEGEHIVSPGYISPPILGLQQCWRYAAVPIYYGRGSMFIFQEESHMINFLRSAMRPSDPPKPWVDQVYLVSHEQCGKPRIRDGIDNGARIANSRARSIRKRLDTKLQKCLDEVDALWALANAIFIDVWLDFGDGATPARGVDRPSAYDIRYDDEMLPAHLI